MIGKAVVPAVERQSESSRAASALSFAILFGGFLTFAVAVYIVKIGYSSLPFQDGWTEVEFAAAGGNPFSPAWLWRQHNEHRLPIPKLSLPPTCAYFNTGRHSC